MAAPLLQQLQGLRQPAPGPIGERKLVTIMFADISGFTAMSETLDPEQVRRIMNGCFDALVPCIHRYGGTIDKFIGDAIMSLFGAPVAQENHAESAARASLDMLKALDQFNRAQGTTLGIHIGINTGLVIAGGMGSQDQQQYSVMGDAVNLAARLEDASERGEILIGAATYRLIARLFDVESRAPISLKGKSEPVPLYRLMAAKTGPQAQRGLPGLRSTLVGRGHEELRLQQAVLALSQGLGARFAILGDAGIGKSRLISEVREAGGGAGAWVEGRALSYTTEVSFFLARQLLLSLIGRQSGGEPSEIDAALRKSVEGTIAADEASTVYLTLGRLLDLPQARTAAIFEGVTPQGMRARVLDACAAYVRARARSLPVVMVWEDLHWADPSSLALLDRLMPLADEVPLLLVLASRGDSGPGLNFINAATAIYGSGVVVFRLAPLSSLDSERLLGNLLNVDLLPGAARQLAPHIFMEVWFGMVIGTALQQGEPVTLVGRGDQRHSFVSVEDVVSVAVAAVDNPAAFNRRIAIGGPEAVSWTEVVRRVAQVIGRDLAVTYVPIGAPLPIPKATWGLMYATEMFEAVIPMDGVLDTFGVSLTPLEEVAKRLFAGS